MDLNISNLEKKQTIKIMEDDEKVAFLDVDPKAIKGKFDVTVTADRPASESKPVRQKQLLDFLAIINQDPVVAQKYPNLRIKIYKLWLEEGGFSDIDYFFEKSEGQEENSFRLNINNRGEGLTPGNINKAVMNPAVNPQTNI